MTKAFFVQEMERSSDMLYRIAFTLLRNNEACRDALQETALKAWEKRDTLREESYFRTWATRILINVCHDAQYRCSRTVLLDELPDLPVPPPDPTLDLVLRRLPAQLRLPLILCYMEGMSYEEAAKALRIPVTTLRSRIHRAKKALRKELETE